MRQRATVFAFFLLVAIGAAGQHAQAANLSVNCDKHECIGKALRLLASANPQGPNTITFRQLQRKLSDSKHGSTDADY